MEQKIQTDSHLLADNELLQPEDIIDNKNLRWMVFKVKQRSMAKYENKITSIQVVSSLKNINFLIPAFKNSFSLNVASFCSCNEHNKL